MFDIGWSELLVIAVVLVVVVGPKDLPAMLRTFGRTTKQLRSMAGDFRRQFDDALREAELDDVKSTVDEMRKLDPRKNIRAAMNPMKAIGDEIRSSLTAATKSEAPMVPSADAAATPSEPDKGAVAGGRIGGSAVMEGPSAANTPSWLSEGAVSSRVSGSGDRASPATAAAAAETSNFPNGRPAKAERVKFSPAHSKWSDDPESRTGGETAATASQQTKSGDPA